MVLVSTLQGDLAEVFVITLLFSQDLFSIEKSDRWDIIAFRGT